MVNYKILKIQRLLKELEIDAYIIPKNDEFFSENIPEGNDRLRYISGFDGSAGTLVITENEYFFFTDSRYEIQAKQQLGIVPIIDALPSKWISSFRKNITRIGYDAWLMPATDLKKYCLWFKMIDVGNLVDKIWNRTYTPSAEMFDYDICFAGEDASDKMTRLARALPAKLDAFLITDVDQISWLLNKRSNCFKYLPSVPGFLVFYPKDIKYDLFFDKEEFLQHCQKLHNVGICMNEISAKIATSLTNDAIALAVNPLHEFMAVKNECERESITKVHEYEGAAICNFLSEMNEIDEIDEYQASNLLEEFRSKQPYYKGKSFETILCADENAAIVHYHPTEKTYKTIKNFFLLDCGSQYLGGTTDMTRTVAIRNVNREIMRNYTLVLKGHIALASAVFPEGTTGVMLDTLARQYLWQYGLDYRHGTGHGVGNFLNVHEGNIRISPRGTLPLKEGVVISCEPGFYKENSHGIRIENLVMVKKHENKGFLCFENLTLVPYDKKMIDKKLLTQPEIDWINAYHATVYKKLSGKVNDETWLKQATALL